MGTTTPLASTYALVEELPVFNPPGADAWSEVDAIGVRSECCSSAEALSRAFTTISHGESGAARVLLHSGQAVVTVTDMAIAGREGAVPFELQRRHTTRRDEAHSIFGPAWSCNLEQWAIEVPGSDDIEFHGFGRTDRYTYDSAQSTTTVTWWNGGLGRLDRAKLEPATVPGAPDTLTLYRRGGVAMVYDAEEVSGEIQARLRAIIAPTPSNTILVNYSTGTGPLIERRITSVVDSFGRTIVFNYTGDLVTSVVDFDGRTVSYAYDADDALVSVTSPAVSSTGGLADFASGKTTTYDYVKHGTVPELFHALEAIRTPRQDALGPSTLSWTYYDDSIAHASTLGWVESHTVGNPSAGGTLAAGGTFDYAYAAHGSGVSTAPFGGVNTRTVVASVTDPRGVASSLTLNRFGHVLEETIAELGSGLRPNSMGPWTSTFTYTDDGLMLTCELPLGNSCALEYPAVPSSRFAAGNVEAVEWSPDGTRPTPITQSTLRSEYVHEPVFQKILESVSVRGFEGGNSPADHTTVQLYSYMEDLTAANTAFRDRLGMTESELDALFTALGVAARGDVDINGDGRTDQICGLLVKVIHPDATIPTVTGGTIGTTTQSAAELFAHNTFGQLLFHQDAEQNVHEYEYFGADDPDGDGTVDTSSTVTSTGGYLKQVSRDTTSQSGRNSGFDPTPVSATTSYEYKGQVAAGTSLPGNGRGLPTRITDPRGVARLQLVNELDQVVSTFAAVSVPAMSGLTAFSYRTNHLHDADDNLVEVQVQRTDLVDTMVDEFVRTVYTHDILGMVVRVVEDEGGMGHFAYTTEHVYDASGNRIETVRAAGLPEEATEQWTFDERHIQIAHTRGVGESEESTTSTEIDANGNVTIAFDAHDADETRYAYDGYDRVIQATDRVGTVTTYSHDAAGNVVETEVVGTIDFLMTTPATLSRTHADFDERGRRYRSDTELFHLSGFAFGTLDDGDLGPGDDLVTHLAVFDRLGRTILSIDADTDEFETRYNGMGWAVETSDPIGNTTVSTFDANGNVLERLETDVSQAGSANEPFSFEFEYDALNRRTRSTQPNAQITTTEYDSLGSVIRTSDELGNQVEFTHDRLRRQVMSEQFLTASGAGATSGAVLDPSQGGGDGIIRSHTVWDALGRRRAVYDDNDDFGGASPTPVTFEYDTLGRRVGVTYGDGTSATWTYNADSELVGHETQQGARIEYTTDAEGRVSVVETDLTGVTDTTTTIVVSVRQQYAWDGLGRLWASTDENSPLTVLDTVTVVHWYDSLGRVIHEAQAISGDSPNALVVRHEYEGATRLVSTTYPDGRVVSRSYDGLDRDILVDDEDVGAPTPDVADTLYVGRTRIALRTYGNGTFLDRRDATMASTISGTDAGYDANRRDVLIQWRNAGTVPIAGWEYTHDDANMVLTETRRHHLDGMGTPLIDTHTRDSAHRSIAFDRDSGASTPSARVLDGAGKMIEFGDEATAVDVDVDDAMSQYVDLDPNGTPTKPRSYDDLGNLIDDESTRTYSYDAFGRLVFVFEAGPTLAAWYFYDAHDRRVLTVRGTEALQFAYGGDGKVLEERILTSLSAFGDPLRQYVWDETSGRVMQMRTTTRVFVEAEAESDPAPRRGPSASPIPLTPASPSAPLGGKWVKTNSYHYYHHNGRGDVGLVSGVRGGVVEYQVYSWLGRMDVLDENGDPVAGNVSVVGSPWGLTGMRIASETGWWSANCGFFDPRVGEPLCATGCSIVVGAQATPREQLIAESLRGDGWPWGEATLGGESGTCPLSISVEAGLDSADDEITLYDDAANPEDAKKVGSDRVRWGLKWSVVNPRGGGPFAPRATEGRCKSGRQTDPCEYKLHFSLDIEPYSAGATATYPYFPSPRLNKGLNGNTQLKSKVHGGNGPRYVATSTGGVSSTPLHSPKKGQIVPRDRGWSGISRDNTSNVYFELSGKLNCGESATFSLMIENDGMAIPFHATFICHSCR